MHTTLPALSNEQLTTLLGLIEQIEFTDKKKRMGVNGVNNVSVYTYSKWKSWNRNQVKEFKSMFSNPDIDRSIIGWFLKFPAEVGFLDLMTTWVGKPCGSIIAYSLADSQVIWLNGREVTVNRGQGIKFSLSVPHEVKPVSFEQNWACLMLVS